MFVVLDVTMTRRALAGRTLVAAAAVAVRSAASSPRPARRAGLPGYTTLRARVDALGCRHAVAARSRRTATDEPLQSSEWWRADVQRRRPHAARPGRAGHDRRQRRRLRAPGVRRTAGPRCTQQPGAGAARRRPRHRPSRRSSVRPATASACSASIRPQSIRTYDASLGDGTRLPSSDIAAGIVAAAAAADR